MKRVTHQPSCTFMKMPQRCSHWALLLPVVIKPARVRLAVVIVPTRDSSAGRLSERRRARGVCQSESNRTSQIGLVSRLVYPMCKLFHNDIICVRVIKWFTGNKFRMIQRTWQGLCESSLDTDLRYNHRSPNILINAHRLFHRINMGEVKEPPTNNQIYVDWTWHDQNGIVVYQNVVLSYTAW